QASGRGLVTHQMAGYDHAAARQLLEIPEGYALGSVIALGYQGEPAALPNDQLMAREIAPRERKPLSEMVFSTCAGRHSLLTGARPRSRNATSIQTRRANAASGPGSVGRRRMGWKRRLILASSVLILGMFAWGAIARQLAPISNTPLTRFDAIIVLGAPVDDDGNPTPEQLARVTEAVHEYERGVAPRLILTGGTDRNRFVEANV